MDESLSPRLRWGHLKLYFCWDKGNTMRPVITNQEEEGAENIIVPTGVRPVVASGVRMRWGRFLQASVIAIVLIECAFIVRLDVLNASYSAAFNLKGSYSQSGSKRPRPWLKEAQQNKTVEGVLYMGDQKPGVEDLESDKSDMCSEEWLEMTDRISLARNFSKEPVLVHSSENQVHRTCDSHSPCVLCSQPQAVQLQSLDMVKNVFRWVVLTTLSK